MQDHEPHHAAHADVMRTRAHGCYLAAAITALVGAALIITGVLLHATGHHEHTSVWVFNPGLTSFGIVAMLVVAGANYSGHAEAAATRALLLEQVASLDSRLCAAENRVQVRIGDVEDYVRRRVQALVDMAEAAAASATSAAEAAAQAAAQRGPALRQVNGHHPVPPGLS